MKEFDFEELDKAVNSLMGDVKTPEAPAATPMTPSPAAIPATPAPAAPEPAPAVSPTLPVNNTTPAPSEPVPSPARPVITPPRPSGRFMDVVHPSADMKIAPTPPVSTPSREGITVQPPARAQETVSSTRPVVDIMTPSNVKSPQPNLETDKTPEPVAVPLPETAPTPPVTAEPWTSPFLPDAQVEKRPLGSTPPASPSLDLSQELAAELSKDHVPAKSVAMMGDEAAQKDMSAPKVESDTQPDEKTQEPTKQLKDDEQLVPEIARLPAELNSDLVAIESGQVTPNELEPTSGNSSARSASPSVGSLAGHAMNTASIPQQYSEQPSSGDESHTPIYDNEAVHQPLAHPAKKKSGWMLVVFIVIILVIGGALGAAAYYFGLI